mgnify:FL=1
MKFPFGPRSSAFGAVLLAIAFGAIVLCGLSKFARNPFDTQLLALLPERLMEELSPELEARVKAKLTTAEADRITVLVEVPGNPEAARIARRAYLTSLLDSGLFAIEPVENADVKALALENAAGRLITSEDRAFLENASSAALDERLAATLLNPAGPGILGIARDPLGLYDRWVLEKAATLPVHEVEDSTRNADDTDGTAPKTDADRVFALRGRDDALVVTLRVLSGAAETGEGRVGRALQEARRSAQNALRGSEGSTSGADAAASALRIDAAGVPLFTDAAATRARDELGRIGAFSTAGVLLFALAFFGRIATLVLLAGSVAAGFAAGLGAALGLFDSLALVTFVFGATLIGVAVDYGAHWFAFASSIPDPIARRRALAPGLLTAALSSALAYGVLIATPLPGLRQMGLLAAGGLLTTLAVVLFWLPYADRWAPRRDTRLVRFLETRLPRLPRWDELPRLGQAALALGAVAFLAVGAARIEWASGIRDLQFVPAGLAEAQTRLSTALRLPSPAQVFVVSSATEDAVLAAEERLLTALRADPTLDIQPLAMADYVPSAARQAEDARLVREALRRITPRMTDVLGAGPQLPDPSPEAPRVTADAVLATPFGAALGHLRLTSEADVAAGVEKTVAHLVMLSGVRAEHLEKLRALESVARADGPDASATSDIATRVRFVNLTGDMETILTRYRNRVLESALAGFGLLALVALRIFGLRNAWRALLPALFGMLGALAAFGWAGIPVTLFTTLAIVLVLGLGVDYGIFLTRSPTDGRTAAAVLFSGVTTLLSFGLLAASETPALAAFGWTVVYGLCLVWTIAQLVRPRKPLA